MRSRLLYRALALLTCLLTVVAGTAVFAAPAGAAPVKTPKASRHFSATIEDLASYVEQTSCDPHVKKGTKLLGDLLAHTYSGTTWGSTRPCASDTSEHYDGRAIDWMVSAREKKSKAQAQAFIKWLLAPDKYGNDFAMARRLGVMYVIFNSRMWGAWSGKWEEYNGCQHGKLRKRAYDNTCHRTHVHISLSWNGARGRTTFWTGKVAHTDYGPCRKKGHKYAPKWSHRNPEPCPGQWP